MVSSISSNNNISAMQLLKAQNAFSQINNNNSLNRETQEQVPDIKDDNVLLNNVNIDEIKNFASKLGDNNLTNEDIKYGLVYGRSVLADFSA